MNQDVRVLYVVYWGALEPLGQSLVLPAMRELSRRGARLTLVTFEKRQDLLDSDLLAETRRLLAGLGVRWLALGYHKRPKVPATAFDVANGVLRGLLSHLGERPQVVHGRTFLGGIIGMPLARLLGARFVYHNEGFYPDEQLDGGVWHAGALLYRAAKRIEARLYAGADALIVLSRKAKADLLARPGHVSGRPISVVPSCVDLERFKPHGRQPLADGVLRLVYIGNVELRYLFEKVARFVAVNQRAGARVVLRVLTRADHGYVNSALRQQGVQEGSWSIDSVPHSAMPAELQQQDAGLFFLTQGLSEHGCSPTKVGEYWASGLPVVTTPNAGDSADVVERDQIGVVVRSHDDEAYAAAGAQLIRLLRSPGLVPRCRLAAEAHYGLKGACEAQLQLYRTIGMLAAV